MAQEQVVAGAVGQVRGREQRLSRLTADDGSATPNAEAKKKRKRKKKKKPQDKGEDAPPRDDQPAGKSPGAGSSAGGSEKGGNLVHSPKPGAKRKQMKHAIVLPPVGECVSVATSQAHLSDDEEPMVNR